MICGTVYDIWNVARKWRPAAVISLYSFNKLIINVTDLNRAIHVPSWRSRASPNRASTTCSFAVPVSGTLKFTAIWRPPKEDGRYVSFNFIHYLSLSRSVTCTFSSSGPFFFIFFYLVVDLMFIIEAGLGQVASWTLIQSQAFQPHHKGKESPMILEGSQ